ncbi:MAG: hypothetical protein IT257_03360 [Chitinophagaceae bacterium]|nr:hypothetical protein [Chitinophagaceae bacterium]
MKNKIKEWIKRYLPAELLSVIVTMLAAKVTYEMSGSLISTAIAATWAGNISYFGYILVNDVVIANKRCTTLSEKFSDRHFSVILKAMALEFGVAELIDTILVRPAMMYYFPLWLNNLSLGIFTAKIVADLLFYIPAIICYEIIKKKKRN